MSEEKNKTDFIIKDRRFSAQEADGANADLRTDDKSAGETPEGKTTDAAEPGGELPEINFMTFIMSLNASAMVHLGIIEDPVTGQKAKNLSLGKQTIDMLGMLEEKTRGNLTKDEENMLKNILYDLRIIYVKVKT